MDGPLVISRDPALAEELSRLSAAAGVTPDLVGDPRAALPRWSGAPLVFVGADCVAELAGVSPARRERVLVAAPTPGQAAAAAVLAPALAVGAEHVVALPHDSDAVVTQLTDLSEPAEAPGTVLGVLGGSGGAGATTLACALGQAAARTAPSLVLDTDPLGPGVDRVLGLEEEPGLRWDEWRTSGRLGAGALRDAVPRRDGVGVLGWSDQGAEGLEPIRLREALSAGQRGHPVVVVDLPRTGGDLVDEVAARCDLLLVAVRAGLSGVASARRVTGRFADLGAVGLVVRGRGADPGAVARVCGRPVLAAAPDQRGLDEAVDLGLGPLRSHRGPLARTAAAVLAGVSADLATVPADAVAGDPRTGLGA